jgi:hypothetical protein
LAHYIDSHRFYTGPIGNIQDDGVSLTTLYIISCGFFESESLLPRTFGIANFKKAQKRLSPRSSFLIITIMKKPSYQEFEATSLYCPRCKAAVPVRKRLLLVLPEGDEYEYLCAYCSSSVGTKIDKNAPQIELLLKP